MAKQEKFFDMKRTQSNIENEQIECLGMTFESEEARRRYFLQKLREGLYELHEKLAGVPFTTVDEALSRLKSIEKWPMGNEEQLRKLCERMREAHRREPEKDLLQLWKDQVGFPHGEIEDILALSDPPYYTACPNPFLEDFIRHYGKSYDPKTDSYKKEPFASDVTEGKNDPIYNAHSYHTKVPHKAIMRYILHYTEPGDIVFDGFCGTGMTGVAAQLCGDRAAVESLGYKVLPDGTILDEEGKPFSKLGPRYAVLNDLSPAATFIAYNYNTPVDVEEFEREAKRILEEVEEECGWMYVTLHHPSREQLEKALELLKEGQVDLRKIAPELPVGRINYTVWSDVFICPNCAGEVIFWEAAVDREKGKVLKKFPCPHCSAMLTKTSMDRACETKYDSALGKTIRQAKQVPVLINYTFGRKRFEKTPDDFDLALIKKIEESEIPYWFPTDRMPEGDEARRNDDIGITHVHHFYTRRNLWVLGALRYRVNQTKILSLHYWLNSLDHGLSKRVKHGNWSFPMSVLSGTLYVPAVSRENNPFHFYDIKRKKQVRALLDAKGQGNILSTFSTSSLIFKDNSIDYIFTDPPFGGNLMYSELNFLWEAWLKVFTNNKPEAVENRTQGKGLLEYQELMTQCFREYYKVLKPGRWMTVEFHNSKNAVWNAIQEALQKAGFVVADVRVLDKKQGTFKQVTSSGAVKQDLIISAYKPNGGLEERFKLTAGTEEGVWDFVRTHLEKLPIPKLRDGELEIIAERQQHLLFDRMVAFHVQRGVLVPISAAEFYEGLRQRFPERDGMFFTPEQVAEYDKLRLKAKGVKQLELFVVDESSAIQWLERELTKKPQTFQELHPKFIKEIQGWVRYEKPLELLELLEENFLMYDGKGPIPKQIVSWMKKSERLREKIRAIEAEKGKTGDLGLETDDPELIKAAKDRWYVPDPRKAKDLEKLREKRLLKEFEEYKQSSKRKLKTFRTEALRAGFKKAWQERDYRTIVEVARKIPERILQEDPKLLMWYDQALTRLGEE